MAPKRPHHSADVHQEEEDEDSLVLLEVMADAASFTASLLSLEKILLWTMALEERKIWSVLLKEAEGSRLKQILLAIILQGNE